MNNRRHILAEAPGRRKLTVIVHGASHPLPEANGGGAAATANGKWAVRVQDAADFKRARSLFPLRPRAELSPVAVVGTAAVE